MHRPPAAAVIVIVLIITGVILGQPGAIRFDQTKPSSALTVFAGLLVVALLVERSLEVGIHTWCGQHADELDQAVQNAQIALDLAKKTNTGDLANLESKLQTAVVEQRKDWGGTRRIALWSGAVLGLAVSAAGFRAIENLLTPESIKIVATGRCWLIGFCTPGSGQISTFRVLDVIVTGGVIAGGSDGVHKIMQLYSEYMDSTADKVKEQANK